MIDGVLDRSKPFLDNKKGPTIPHKKHMNHQLYMLLYHLLYRFCVKFWSARINQKSKFFSWFLFRSSGTVTRMDGISFSALVSPQMAGERCEKTIPRVSGSKPKSRKNTRSNSSLSLEIAIFLVNSCKKNYLFKNKQCYKKCKPQEFKSLWPWLPKVSSNKPSCCARLGASGWRWSRPPSAQSWALDSMDARAAFFTSSRKM